MMAITWLKEAARSCWEDRLQDIQTADGVVDRLEQHFLHSRARRINEERWNALTYQLVRSRQLAESPQGAQISHESTLNLLFNEIDTLSDLCVYTGRDDESILIKIISAVRTVDLYRPIFLQPPSFVDEMKTSLRGMAVEADKKALLERMGSLTEPPSSFVNVPVLPDADSEDAIAEACYIDRRFLSDPTVRKIPGYGARYSTCKGQNASRRDGQLTRRGSRGGTKGYEISKTPRGVELTLRNGSVVNADQFLVCFETGCDS